MMVLKEQKKELRYNLIIPRNAIPTDVEVIANTSNIALNVCFFRALENFGLILSDDNVMKNYVQSSDVDAVTKMLYNNPDIYDFMDMLCKGINPSTEVISFIETFWYNDVGIILSVLIKYIKEY